MPVKITDPTNRPLCPECNTVMGKKSRVWSGRNRKQLWLCSKCGRTRLLPIDGNGHSPESIPYLASVRKPKAEVTFLPPVIRGKDGRICDGLIPIPDIDGAILDELPAKLCPFFEGDHCGRLTWTRNCKFKQDEWRALPTRAQV